MDVECNSVCAEQIHLDMRIS